MLDKAQAKYKKSKKGRAANHRYRNSAKGKASRQKYRSGPKFKATHHAWILKNQYGLTTEGYDAIYKSQNGLCAICGGTSKSQPLSVDHDHLTGSIRGLLCLKCNSGLGLLGDTVEALQKATTYLMTRRIMCPF